MCIYSLTDYMLLVSVIDVYFHGSTAVYMHIHITLFTEGIAACVGGVQWRMKKMIVNPLSMLVERQCVIY